MTKPTKPSLLAFEKALALPHEASYILRLYIAGVTPRSTQAVANIKAFCERFLADRYELEVSDIYQQPNLAQEDQIVAAPTLIKKLPLPQRRLVGDMTDTKRVLAGLDLRHKD
ncbi:MAG: circadian clock KaiB family protein [Aggregatilineales bacterium]